MASLLDRQLIARATGQASRRGLILRQPSGEQLLADVEAWLLVEYPDAVRRTHLRPTGDDQAQLTVALHPAAPDLRMLAWDNGRVDVVAETVTAGPGYHRFVGRVLERLGLEQSISWSRDDPLNVTFGERPIVEQAYLTWLGPRLVKAHKAAAAGRPAPQLGLPEGTRYTFDGAIATALGPRDIAWLEAAIADPRVAVDVTPWWADATDARYLLNRALCLMWLDVRWRAPAVQGEAELIDEVHRLLSKAFPLEPGLPYPWHAWRELARVRGLYDHMAGQVIDRAKTMPAPAGLIGYRRDAGRADPRRLGARGAGLLRRGTHRGRAVGRRRRDGRSPSPRRRPARHQVRCPPRTSSIRSRATSGQRPSPIAPARCSAARG